MTRLDIRTRARKKLGEKTAVFWADDELNGWMEEAALDIAWKAKLKKTRATFTTLANTARYNISSIFPDFLRILSGGVWIYDSTIQKWRKLFFKTKEYMDEFYPQWVNAPAAKPIFYMEDTEEDILELYPTPVSPDCVGQNYCRVYYSARPVPMSSDSASPDLDKQGLLHPAVIEYLVATGFETRGYGDLANDHWSKYNEKIKSFLIEKDGYKEDDEIIMKSYRSV